MGSGAVQIHYGVRVKVQVRAVLLSTGGPERAISYWVLKLYSQLWGQVYYGVRVKVQVYYGVMVRVLVRAVLLATGGPEEVIGLLVTNTVCSVYRVSFYQGVMVQV